MREVEVAQVDPVVSPTDQPDVVDCAQPGAGVLPPVAARCCFQPASPREGETESEYRARLRKEIRGPTRLLRKRLGVPSDAFSFPYGDANDDVISALKAEGYELAMTVTRGGNPAFADPYRLRRTMIYAEDGLSNFRRRLQTFQPMDARR